MFLKRKNIFKRYLRKYRSRHPKRKREKEKEGKIKMIVSCTSCDQEREHDCQVRMRIDWTKD